MNYFEFYTAQKNELLPVADPGEIKVRTLDAAGDIRDVLVLEYERETNTLWLKTEFADEG